MRAIAILLLVGGLAAAASADDAAQGRALYEGQCAPCHFSAELPLETGAAMAAIPVMMATYGPRLSGIIGRAAGADPTFLYSRSFGKASAGLVWSAAALDRFLIDSRAMFPGIRMFYRQPDAEVRRRILAYLATTG